MRKVWKAKEQVTGETILRKRCKDAVSKVIVLRCSFVTKVGGFLHSKD
jgi:hypothetical protein